LWHGEVEIDGKRWILRENHKINYLENAPSVTLRTDRARRSGGNPSVESQKEGRKQSKEGRKRQKSESGGSKLIKGGIKNEE
jgi:hypothetical protein